jgi:hypothetical protein
MAGRQFDKPKSEGLTDGDFWLDDPAAFEDPSSYPPPTPRAPAPRPPPSRSDAERAAPTLLEALRSPAPTAGSNRRQFERHAMDRPARVTEMDEFGNPGPCWLCRIVDVSRGGMGLRSKRMVHVGRGMLVEIDGIPPAQTKLLFGLVRQSRYAEGEGYAVGIQFKALPATTSVRNWMAARGLRL